MPSGRKTQGFTLVELVIVIVLSGILASVVMQFITTPIEAYVDQSRRARLVDIAHNAMTQLSREVRQALPNSVRAGCLNAATGHYECVEFLRVVAGGRYRAAPTGPGALSFIPADNVTSFDILGPLGFRGFGAVDDPTDLDVDSSPDACVTGNADCLVIYNTGQDDFDAWNRNAPTSDWKPDNMAALVSVSSSSIQFNNGHFSGGTAFPAASPGQRFYIVDSPVSFVCEAGELRRYENYPLAKAAAQNRAASTDTILIANQVDAESCEFKYDPGSFIRNGLLTVALTISETEAASGAEERVRLVKQVHVVNLP